MTTATANLSNEEVGPGRPSTATEALHYVSASHDTADLGDAIEDVLLELIECCLDGGDYASAGRLQRALDTFRRSRRGVTL